LQRFSSGPSLIANLPGALLLKESTKMVPDRRVVVYHQNSNQVAHPSWGPRLKGGFDAGGAGSDENGTALRIRSSKRPIFSSGLGVEGAS
jgi:hypothetical protein